MFGIDIYEGRGRKMILTKKQTKSLQGIAILFMLGLHLFNRIDIAGFYDVKIYWGGIPLLTYISYIFDACVPIYLFCSGYGLYVSEASGNTMKKRIQRVFKLLIRFLDYYDSDMLCRIYNGNAGAVSGKLVEFCFKCVSD